MREICGTGDDRIVPRPVLDPDQDDPLIHYGLTASGQWNGAVSSHSP